MGKIHLKDWKGSLANILIMLIGISLTFFWPQIWNHFLLKQFEIRPGTIIHMFWKDQPLMYFDAYLFNWTNHEDFTNHSIKPKFEELGPYRYKLHSRIVNITYHDNSTVSYKRLYRFNFLPEQSCGKLDDIVITPNIIAFGTSNQAKSFNIIKLKGVEWSLAFFGQEMTIKKTASELLFEGYEDSLISIASEISKIIGYEMPFEDRYGLFFGRNESTKLFYSYNIDTRTSHLGQIRHFSGISKPEFLETHCESFQEVSAGELFPPHVAKNSQQISFYTEQMCRAVHLDFEEDVEVNGIKGRKFIGGERMIDNGTKYPKNKCYCNGECVRSGVLNSTACCFGVPVFSSYPHFYKADPYYLDQIEGMKPEKEKHEFFVTLEPTTSLILKGSARVQISILIRPIPMIKMYSNVPTKFIPIMWVEQSFEINKQTALLLKLVLWTPLIGQIIGSIITIISIYLIYRLNNAKEKDEKCIKEKDKSNEILKNGVAELRPLVNENNTNVMIH